jgi:putative iron-regulated protein
MAQYADIAQAMFDDALASAKTLQTAVEAFLAKPDDATLAAARKAWIDARPWYMQTEGLRFGNPIVDEWEGRVNAWPLDEGLIDYVDTGSYGETSDENPLYRANVVASKSIRIGKKQVDATTIDTKLLESLQEAGGVEANVAIGYHAIEFLLWGQDLNGTGPGAGARPASDYDTASCTHGNCDRRRDYLKAATDLLVKDLAEMAANWKPDGAARKALSKKKGTDGLAVIATGIGSLSYGELAGERMKLGVMLHDPEEEQDCFSDNTHNSHYFDEVGMIALYNARYRRLDGSVVEGPSLAAYAAAKVPEQAAALDKAMATTLDRLAAIKAKAETGGMAYDQMLASGNEEGNKLIMDGVDGLVAQARALESVVGKLGLKIKVEGSDSLDDPAKVKTE